MKDDETIIVIPKGKKKNIEGGLTKAEKEEKEKLEKEAMKEQNGKRGKGKKRVSEKPKQAIKSVEKKVGPHKKEKFQMNEKDHKLFNEMFFFPSQRFIEAEKSTLLNWDKGWHLTSQNTVIFKNLDKILAGEIANVEDKESYIELKTFFKENSLLKKEKSPLGKQMEESLGVKESAVDLVEYAKKTRALLYLYKKYYEPLLVEDLKDLSKKDLSKKDLRIRDFFIKAFPLLSEAKQATIYQLLVKDSEQVDNIVVLPSYAKKNLKINNDELKKLKELEGQKKLNYKKYEELKRLKVKKNKDSDNRSEQLKVETNIILSDLVKLPIDQFSFLHEKEVDNLLSLVKASIVVINSRINAKVGKDLEGKDWSQKEKKRKVKGLQNKDLQYSKYKKIEFSLVEENTRRSNIEKENLKKINLEKVSYANGALREIREKFGKYKKIRDEGIKEINDFDLFIKGINKKSYPELHEILVDKKKTEYSATLSKYSEKSLQTLRRDLSSFNIVLKDVRKVFLNHEEKKRAEEYRDKIMGHLRTADLKTAREFWIAMGEKPRDISARFAAGDMKNVPVKIRKKMADILTKKRSKEKKKSLSKFDKLTLDSQFNKKYEKLGELISQNKEKTKVYEKLGKDFSAAKTKEEKEKLYQKLETVEDDTINLSFSKLKKDLLIFADNHEKEEGDSMRAVLNEMLEEFENVQSNEERLVIYEELKSMHHDLANLTLDE